MFILKSERRQKGKRDKIMEKEMNTTNSSEGTAEKKAIEQNGNTSSPKRKLISICRFLGFVVLFMIVFGSGLYYGYQMRHKVVFGRALKFMEQKKELTVEQFSADPIIDRDLAWSSEDVPNFIALDYHKAALLNYDGVEYSFGENKIRVEEEFMRDDLEIIVNSDLGWTMSNFSIYSSGENITIYGYWNDEFRRITMGKTQESIIKEVLTLDSGVPFSANSKYISDEAKRDYIFVISEDMRTVSAYKDTMLIGEKIVLPNEILGFYDGIMILAKSDDYTDKLYMPYVVTNNGKEEFVCIEIATVSAGEVENVSSAEYMDAFHSYTTNYSARMDYVLCYFFENDDGMIRMIVPNNIQKYAAYRRGTDILTSEDDLGWHWITISE